VLGIAAAIVFCVLWWIQATCKRKAYRRAGLALLADARTTHDVSVILKRVALAVFPREQVASLYGDDWIAFLNRTCSRCDFPRVVTVDAGAEATDEFLHLAGTWIRHHRVYTTPNAKD